MDFVIVKQRQGWENLTNKLFQKIRTIELDGKTVKLQIVSKFLLSLH